MTAEPEPETVPTAACCGELKPANTGHEPTNACIVCPLSPTFWRKQPDAAERRSWEHPSLISADG